MDEICTHIGIIEAGEIIIQGPIKAIRGLSSVIDVKQIDPDGNRRRIQLSYDGEDEGVSAILQALTSQGISVMNFAEESSSLEKVFMKATKGIIT